MRIPSSSKYRPYLECFPVDLPDRTWPDQVLSAAPIWCSVDLRDGNQALINPMNLEKKLEMFKLLVEIGFPEIEIGFPSASAVEFEFTRALIEQRLIPSTVTPQVLTQARAPLIERTFESLRGAEKAIVHLYNSTSELQRRVVFRKGRDEILALAVEGTRIVKQLASETDTRIIYQYSPESFTGTELEYALEVCEAVIDAWDPSPEAKMILNLPATVEMATPNVHADQIEWFLRRVKRRDSIILSLHPHNDRGTAVAAAELGVIAGGERVEGTLFGNGERTGNVDIVTLALNMYSQGVDPRLALDDIARVRQVAEVCTEIPVHVRHPYAGELVFTAFSGSHQDAISKGLRELRARGSGYWEVPYLPVDPSDLGRKYDAIIRINSQSGKGGVAYVMQQEFGCELPRDMHPEFSAVIQRLSDEQGTEIRPEAIWSEFSREYLERRAPFRFVKFRAAPLDDEGEQVEALLTVEHDGSERVLRGVGNGPIDACLHALIDAGVPKFKLTNFSEHARSAGSDAEAVAYVQIETEGGERRYGVGIHSNTSNAAIKALLSALNRAS